MSLSLTHTSRGRLEEEHEEEEEEESLRFVPHSPLPPEGNLGVV